MLDVERLVDEDHPVRAIWELVGRLDLSAFVDRIGSLEGGAGRPAFDPQLLVSLWIYAYSRGIGSAREVERRCEHDPGFRWLTGLLTINHHTLSDFRLAHHDALDEIFTQVLGILSAEGLITLQTVMHDGTKITAQAGPGSFKLWLGTMLPLWEIPAVRARHRGKPQPASGRAASAWSGSNKPSSTFSRSVPPSAPAMLARARNRSA
jgi:transposase